MGEKKVMEKALFKAALPYLTTPYLLSLYSDYKSPRDKIKNLVKNGDLIHLKQGLYILGEMYGRTYSKEVISGILYGPSAVSLEYALSFHGLIPERVEEITCICFKRAKIFRTPIGRFSYTFLPVEKYTCGLTYQMTELGNYLIASPEKALCDKVYFSSVKGKGELSDFLFSELRIEKGRLRKLDPALLSRLAQVYRRMNCRYLVEMVIGIRQEKE
jgi:hypothetical protein